MTILDNFRFNKRNAQHFLLVAAALLPLHIFIESQTKHAFEETRRIELDARLGDFRYQVESILTNNMALINGLAAFISSYPDFTNEQFNAYSASVLARAPALINMSASRDMVVTNVYPPDGNEGVLGLDYHDYPAQRRAAERVMEQDALVIAGPVKLIQGGVAFIGRAPVHLGGQDKLWGMVAAPILASHVFASAGLDKTRSFMQLAIRGRDGLGSKGEVFLGDAAIFADPLHISMPVHIGGGEWELGALPLPGAPDNGTTILLLRMVTLIIAASALMLLAIFRKQRQVDQAYRAYVVRSEKFMNQVESVSRVGGWRLNQNAQFTELTGQARELAGLRDGHGAIALDAWCANFVHGSAKHLKETFLNALTNHRSFETDIEVVRQNGEALWLHIQGEIHGGDGPELELIGAIQDITESKQALKMIEFQNHFDPLTRLPNRLLLMDRLQSAINRATRNKSMVAVCFLDIDNFKAVNDNLGHAAGDRVLVEVSERILKRIRASDTLARYSGDEFLIVLGDVINDQLVVSVVADLVDEIARPFRIYGQDVFCGVSIGVSMFSEDGSTPDELIIKADQAMHAVKKSGRNGWQYYMNQMQVEAEKRHRMYNELAGALQNNELSVHYQPIVDAQTLKVVSCEALVRWRNKSGEWVQPELFVGIAEERGLVEKIDYFVMQEACRTLREINRSTGLDIGLSLNISPRMLLLRGDTASQWVAGIRKYSDLRLSVEITERVLVETNTNVLKLFDDLRQLNIGISLDDFGTGYSGLSYFSRFPVTSIKIDRSFVNRMTTSTTQRSLVESMLIMAEKLNVVVIAEGVESEEEMQILRDLRCTYLQGYYIARALPAERFQDFVMQGAMAPAAVQQPKPRLLQLATGMPDPSRSAR